MRLFNRPIQAMLLTILLLCAFTQTATAVPWWWTVSDPTIGELQAQVDALVIVVEAQAVEIAALQASQTQVDTRITELNGIVAGMVATKDAVILLLGDHKDWLDAFLVAPEAVRDKYRNMITAQGLVWNDTWTATLTNRLYLVTNLYNTLTQ